MNSFWGILIGGILMSAISLIGLVVLFLKENLLKKIIFPLVAFSAGALLGGAFLHMLPEVLEKQGVKISIFVWLLIGFCLFFLLEQFLHWHHCHRMPSEHKKPVTYLILVADAVHNFIGGLAVAGVFVVDIKLGMITWLAAALHEVPQELGDFGILIHGGWEKKKALLYNFISSLTFLIGGLFAYFLSAKIDISFLIPFAAGNFIYIAAADLIPEVKHSCRLRDSLLHFLFFVAGILFLLAVRLVFGDSH